MDSYKFLTTGLAVAVALVGAALLLFGAFAPAAADEGPGDCFGVDFDPQHPVPIGKIAADKPRVYFLKNAADDPACPASTTACQQKACLVPGNLVLIGKTFSDKSNVAYACVVYESSQAKKVQWTKGWLPAASLVPVSAAPAPTNSDWTGDWVHASGNITIDNGAKGALDIHGEAFYAAAMNVHTGVIAATATPARGLLEFADDGTIAFDSKDAECLVRMQRVDALLVVEDNGGCGGALVTFTGLYQKKK
jgi:hypothetical protein